MTRNVKAARPAAAAGTKIGTAVDIETLGQKLAPRYEVVRLIGQGATGVVYEAIEPTLQRRVAIKVFTRTTSRTTSPNDRDRFLREARAHAHLEHRNILTLIAGGDVDGHAYYLMPYVAESLADRLRRGPLPTAAALTMIDDLQQARNFEDRHRALTTAVTFLEKLMDRLSPWYIRYDKLVTAIVAMLGIVPGLATLARAFFE